MSVSMSAASILESNMDSKELDFRILNVDSFNSSTSLIYNHLDCRWFPGCENKFHSTDTSVQDEWIGKCSSVEAKYEDEKYKYVLKYSGFSYGRPCYEIAIFENNYYIGWYMLTVEYFHSEDGWCWVVKNDDMYLGVNKIKNEHSDLSYFPSIVNWQFEDDNYVWIIMLFHEYKKQMRIDSEISDLSLLFSQMLE